MCRPITIRAMRSHRSGIVHDGAIAFAEAIHRHLPRGSKVLDVCSGTHDIPLRLLATDPTLEIHAVDGSPHMTAEGQRRARERNLTIRAQVCDAHTLPFPDNSFDAVTIQFASRHLEIIRAFKEIHRVLKPGGIFCHNDMLRPASRIVEEPYLVYLALFVMVYWQAFREFPREHEVYRLLRERHTALLHAARIDRASQGSRFRRDRKSELSHRHFMLSYFA